MRSLFILLILSLITLPLFAQLQSPFEYLPTSYGEQFTPHHELVNYVEYVAQNSDRVSLQRYGTTNEDRPLMVCYISTPENLKRLEQIQKQHLDAIELDDNSISSEYAIVWLSFGVHGNEAGASESSMNVLYNLADTDNSKTGEWLKNTIVILDPSINPDGYSRYTHWVRGISGNFTHPDLHDREHMEPWPGGRVNHYLFDLNRDWAWQTQVESRQRVAHYNKWMPMIHVDFHEMGYNDHYYFAPAAEPYHPFISDFQRKFQVDIGKNHAKYFDEKGWLYFTREVFDLYYPSYGDTYPIFNGAIGMTHEKAGHGMAGRAIKMNNGDTLTLLDRITEHTTTGLSTVEVASDNASKLSNEFYSYFQEAKRNPAGKYRMYVLKNSPKLPRLVELLDRNGIKYQISNESRKLNGFSYFDNEEQNFSLDKGDVLVPAAQAKSILTQVLLEHSAALKDSLTYDITAWSLPYAYGIKAYGLASPINVSASTTFTSMTKDIAKTAYAYVIPWNNIQAVNVAATLMNDGINLRLANKSVKFDEFTIEQGSIVITKGDNKTVSDLASVISEVVGDNDIEIRSLSTGFSSQGGDLGGGSFSILEKPKVLLLSGDKTSANEVGQVWHYFDQVINFPISVVDFDNLGRVDLNDFNTIIMPDGWYNLSDKMLGEMSSWASKGGKIIALEGALNNFADKEGWALSKFATDDEKAAAEKAAEQAKLNARMNSYEDRERRGISGSIPGAIIENKIDAGHPLTFGLGDRYYSLKTGRQHYKLLKEAWNPIYTPKDYTYYGFIGANIADSFDETTTFAVEEKGRGSVIYMIDNPLYRGFWENGLLLFSNAVFLVP